jgi:hypothetical protein
LFGWRLAFHLMMWDVSEYGGGYTTEDKKVAARRRFRMTLILCIARSIALGYLLTFKS